MKVLVFGAGAVGGYIGAHLVENGLDVTFVARGIHLQNMIDKGLKNSSKYDSRTLELLKAQILLDYNKTNESNLIIERLLNENNLSADHKQLAQELQGKIVS